MFDLKKIVLISVFPILVNAHIEIVSSVTSCSGTLNAIDSNKTVRFSATPIVKLMGDATAYTIAGIQDLEKKIFPVNIRGLKATIYTKTKNRRFFAGQLFELSGYDRLIYPIPSSGKIEFISISGFDMLQYSTTKDGTYTDIVIGDKYSVNGFFQLPENVSVTATNGQIDIKVKSYFYDTDLQSDYTDNIDRVVSINIDDEIVDEYIKHGETSDYKFGTTMAESFNFCKDINFAFVGCGMFNDINNTVDTDGDMISDYDELYYGLNPNNIADGSEDTDGDSMLNNREIIFNTNLNDSNSF